MSGGMGGGEGGVAEDLLTTKGDTHGYTTENARVPIGTDGQVITADSTVPLGLAWATTGGGVEYSQLTTATTFTPTTQTGLVKVTVDGTDMTGGNIDINVDGSTVQNTASGQFENRVVNPATSLTIVSNIDGYEISSASYDSVSFSAAAQESGTRDATFKPDGTKMYIVGNNKIIYQYTLSTPWVVSSASYDSVSFSVGSQDTSAFSLAFKPDGTKFYLLGATNDSVFQYTLSTAWDMSTASYDSISFSVASQETTPYGMTLKPDGTKLYIVGYVNDTVYQYTLSTAWDLSTASYDSISFSVAVQDNSPRGLAFKTDGTKMYIVGTTNSTIFQYTLSTPWVVSSSSYDSVSFSVGAQETYPYSISFKTGGTKFYIIGNNNTVYQYTSSGVFAGTARISIG